MSLLIKGLDMPKLDENEEHLWVPGWIEVGKDGKVIFCTGTHFDPNTIHSYAVEEVPTPHGDLIDKEPIKEFISDGINKPSPESYGYDGIEILSEIEFAPVFIEAEVSE